MLWDRREEGRTFLARAATLDAQVDEALVQNLTHQLLGYQREFGSDAAVSAINELTASLREVDSKMSQSRLRGSYSVNQAFQSYRSGKYAQVPAQILRAIASNPKYLWNRGVLSIFVRSTMGARLS